MFESLSGHKKETTARDNSSRLLTNANITSYLEQREKEINDKAIAKQEEVLKILTAHARRETK
ncbi:terminase small subunit [Helcococcus ovis]|uniref:terminase small subunit n=1 Tax=Helcococcus TaxID=31983 RepID=UPI0038BA7ACA